MNKEKKDSLDYMTKSEALKELGIAYVTFERYCHRLGIEGEREGRCTYYQREQIEKLRKLLESKVPTWINFIEKETGKKVRLV